ncbi:MAG: hypothetical protein WCW26_03670 [Candidatus Buchananbacteria bacterium]
MAGFSVLVKDKPDIKLIAEQLREMGWDIYGSQGTVKYLVDRGESATDFAVLTGLAPIIRHQVVTLQPRIHAGLLARTGPDLAEMEQLGYGLIDLIYVGLYDLAAALANPNRTDESVRDAEDMGGVALLSSGCKGNKIVVCDPADWPEVLRQLKENGDVDPVTRRNLIAKAYRAITLYRLMSAVYWSDGATFGLVGTKKFDLAYGENRYQSPAAFYAVENDDPLAWDKWVFANGVPGYINLADGDRTLDLMCLMAEAFRRNFGRVPYITIACKHGNPCGVGIDWDDPVLSVIKAMRGDTVAVMGAEVMCNFAVTEDVAKALYEVPDELKAEVGRKYWGADVIFAASFDGPAFELLAKRENRRLLVNEAISNPTMSPAKQMLRPIRGGFIVQGCPDFVLNLRSESAGGIEDILNPVSDEDFLADLIIAWAVTWRANSNTVAIAKNGMLLALGCGQQDRMACAELCLHRAERSGHNTIDAAFGSDGFFPFAQRNYAPTIWRRLANSSRRLIGFKPVEPPLEAPELLVAAGCRGGVVPADGKRLEEVKAFFAANKLTMVFVAKENRGFDQH